ncbi:MAG: ABC-F family ATP-binding cassette domain-containing protein [Lachnospiraceae bacterium]|nr:ABC-F family ATP-binding cassette domain-containing protein [Lachnospiraceae bacterium]
MNLITIEHVSKSYTERMLFDDVSLGINEGDRIGIIGINGTGKSTFLKILAGLEEPDAGTMIKGKEVRIAYLPQNPVFSDEMTLLQNITEGLVHPEEYRDIPGEAAAMLRKLGIPETDAVPSTLSGGQRKRAALVRTLLMPADVLILDEPTNHLDSAMTEWLEEYLKKNGKALVMITHDRYFLDAVTNRIVELDKGKLYAYKENYTGFLLLKAEREAMQLATERKNQSLYRQDLAWMMRGARARSTKQKAHIERFEALKNREKIVVDGEVEINALSSRLGKKTIEVEHISKSFGEKTLIRDFSYIFLSTDRIGIIGPNGCGKSTLLKMITGNLAPDTGTVEFGTTIKVGYFMQENEALNPNIRVIDSVREVAEYIETSEGKISASQMCEKFLFTDAMQYTVIGKLSGGEKRRLALLHVLMEAPNVLILDEPTNDLDIRTLSILEDYLTRYNGIVIAVSHDRYFLDKVANRIFSFEGDGVIRRYEGNYSDYRAVCEREGRPVSKGISEGNARGAGAASGAGKAGTSAGSATPGGAGSEGDVGEKSDSRATWKNREQKVKFSYKEQKEYETIDADIAALEDKIATLEEEIAASATNYGKLQELSAAKEAAEAQLEEKMDRWVYLNELAEQIESQK